MSSALVAAAYGGTLGAAGLLPVRDVVPAVVQFWVGDVIGIAVVAPVGLLFFTRGFTGSREMLAQGIAIVAALALIFSQPDQHQFQFFYILFLPIVWMAVRGGLEAVSAGLLLTQIGLIIGIQLASKQNIDVTAFQALMLVLTLTGLIAGAVVTENRRAEMQLRLHQEALARMARVGSVGELAAAIAHEVNQPLMAAGTYTRLLLDTLRSGGRHEDAVETATKAAGQVERASEVIRKLRALFRLDRASKAPTDVRRMVTETLELFGPEMARHAIAVRTEIDESIPLVMVDMLQIEQVLLNLLRNSSEAISETGGGRGVIVIKASRRDGNQVELAVADSGPGFSEEIASGTPALLQSVKAEGLGIGLSLCKTIVEAHGGKLTIVSGPGGGLVHFTVPAASSSE
jgi:signal transduction histidine kinase